MNEFLADRPEEPINDMEDPVVKRATELRAEFQEVIEDNVDNWEEAQDMYGDCFRGDDDPTAQNNPITLKNVIDRGKENYGLVDYLLRVSSSTPQERQILRDMLTQIEINSGLEAAMKNDPRGNFGQFLFGTSLYWFGASDQDDTPIIVQNVRLSQAFFSPEAIMMRSPNMADDVNESLLVFDRTLLQQQEIYKKSPNIEGADIGRLPIFDARSDLQRAELNEEDKRKQLTQDGHYYNLSRGIYKVMIGGLATIVKEFDDNDPTKKNYPFKLNGKNVSPIFFFRTFPVPDALHGKGFYDLFGKNARNSAWRKSRARQWVDRNIMPPAFVKMNGNKYAEFQNQVDIQNEARLIGEDSYIHLEQNDEVVTGDMRNQPLTQEFERLKADDQQEITESGIAIQDVGQPLQKTATVATFEERNKLRLVAEIIGNNAQEGKFVREIFIDFIKKFVKKGNKTPVATNLKLKKKPTEEDLFRAQQVSQVQGISLDQAISQTVEEFSADGLVTYGQVAETLREKNKLVTVQVDFSAWENVGFKLSRLQSQFNVAQGTPAQLEIQQEMLGVLGKDVTSNKVTPTQNAQDVQAQTKTGLGLPTGLPQSSPVQ